MGRSFRAAVALRINRRFFYGWVIVAAGAVGIFASGPGQSHTFGVYFPLITRDLGLTQTGVAVAYGAATLIAAFCLPLMGKLVDRVGARPVALLVAVLLGAAAGLFGVIGTLDLGTAGSLLLLGLSFGLLRFLGQGTLMMCCNNMVAQWFQTRRGFALSLMSWGFAASMSFHPSMARWLTEAVGWQESWLWLGVLTWVLLLPLFVFAVWSKPEDLGLRQDGEPPHQPATAGDPAPVTDEMGMSLRQARATRAFWIVGVSLGSLSALVTGLFLFQVSILQSRGVEISVATTLFTISAATMVLFVPVFGRLLDRYTARRVFAGGLLVMSATLVAASLVQGTRSAVVYALLFGLANAVIHSHYVYLWAHYFGRRHLGSIQGFAMLIGVVGASLGGLPLGWAWDRFESYSGMLWALAVVPALCASLVLTIRAPLLGGDGE